MTARIGETALARESHGTRGRGLWLLVALLIGAPGLFVTMQAEPIPPSAPPSPLLDSFITAVRDRTPQTARVLVAGNPPALVFYRATYLLYPRTVYTAFPTDYAHGGTAPPTDWPSLRRLARQDGADYVLLWALPVTPSGVTPTRSKDGSGALVQLGNGLRLKSHGKPRTLKCLSGPHERPSCFSQRVLVRVRVRL